MRVNRRTGLVGLVILVVVLAGLGYRLWHRPTPMGEAMDRLPAKTLRASFTDWAAVADEVPGSDLTASSGSEKIQAFLDRAFDKDLTTASALSDSFVGLAANFGITPLDAQWEAYGQAREGAVSVLRLDDDVDLDALTDRFRKLGYEEPSEDDGAWIGTPELVVGLDEPLTTVQENLAVVESEHLLLMSDSPEYLAGAVSVTEGDDDSLTTTSGVPDLVSAAGDAVVAVLWAQDFACDDLAMSKADPADVEEADRLVSKAGGVHPLEGLVMAEQPGSTLTVGMVFPSDSQAGEDLQPRTDLASGPAPGQGGTFPERFKVGDATADGRVVTLQLEPVHGRLLGDLGQGPVLFATC